MAKGQLDKAIAELQRLVAADPSDVRTLLKIAELEAKKGSIKGAVDTYVRVGDVYAGQGFFTKSVAVYKQASKLDPTRLDVLEKLAQNYEDLQHTADALATYDQLAHARLAANQIDAALAAMQRATEIDPQNLATRIRYAEALSKANRPKDAADEFERGAVLIKQQGRMDDYIKVAERLLFHREGDLAIAKELAELYLQRNDGKRALAKLQILFKANPKDTGVLALLAEAFITLAQREKAIQVLKELAKIHFEHRQMDERGRALRRVLELDPNDAEAKQALSGAVRPRIDVDAVVPASAVIGGGGRPAGMPARPATLAGGAPFIPTPGARLASNLAPPMQLRGNAVQPAAAPPQPPAAPPALPPAARAAVANPAPPPPPVPHARPVATSALPEEPSTAEHALDDGDRSDDGGIEIDVETELLVDEASSPSLEMPQVDVDSLDDAGRAELASKMFAETKVFERYGLKPKIRAHLERIVAIAPAFVPAREKLRDAYLDDEQTDDAVEQMLAIAEAVAQSDRAYALSQLRQAMLMDDENPDVRRMLRQLDPSALPARGRRARTESEAALPAVSADAALPAEDDAVVFVDDEAARASAYPAAGPDESFAVEDAPIALDDAPYVIEDAPLALDDAPYAVDDAALALDDAPYVIEDAPLALDDAPIALDDAPYAVDDAPIALDDAPYAVDDAPLALDDAPYAVDDAPYAIEDAPLALDDAPLAVEDDHVAFVDDGASERETDEPSGPLDPSQITASQVASLPAVLAFDDDEEFAEVEPSTAAPLPQPPPLPPPASTSDRALDEIRAMASGATTLGANASRAALPELGVEVDEESLIPGSVGVDNGMRDDSLLPPIPLDAFGSSEFRPPAIPPTPSVPAPVVAQVAAPPPVAARPRPQTLPDVVFDERGSVPPLDDVDLDEPISKDEFESAPAGPVAAPTARRVSMVPGAPTEEILEEADFYLAQSLFEEARQTLTDALAMHPNHPLLLEKLAEVDDLSRVGTTSSADIVAGAFGAFDALGLADVPRHAPPEPQPQYSSPIADLLAGDPPLQDLELPPVKPASSIVADAVGRAFESPVDPADDEAFALAEKLAEAMEEELGPSSEGLGADSIDVDLVFQQFKRGVERQVDESDTETHYDLGIAYKEMGLLDDAIGEFEIASRNPDRASIALTMVGLCRIEQGRVDDGIAALERGLAASHRDQREELGLRFELGIALALASRDAEALAQFERVRTAEPTFRGVNEKIAQLRSRLGAGDEAEQREQEELERAFEDLLGE